MGDTSLSQRFFSFVDPLVAGIVPESLTGAGGTPFLGSSVSPAVNIIQAIRGAASTAGTSGAITSAAQGLQNPATAAIASLFGQGAQVQQVAPQGMVPAGFRPEAEETVLMTVKVGRQTGRVRLVDTQRGTCMLSSADLKVAKRVQKTLRRGQRFLPQRVAKRPVMKPDGKAFVTVR